MATQTESRAETPRLRRQGETATLGRTLLAAAALAGIYFVAGTLGLRLAYVHESATAVWPPSGIAIAALLLGGYALAAGVFVGAFLVNLLNPNTYGAVGLCLGIGVGNLLEALLGAWLVTRFAGGRRFIDRAAHLARFAFLAGLVSTLASSLVGVTSLCVGGYALWQNFVPIWFTWWLGDATGALLFTPAILLWIDKPRLGWSAEKTFEAALLFIALVAVSLLVFGGALVPELMNLPLAFLVLPLLVWMAMRFGPRETATGTLLLSVFAVAGTVRGDGPFGEYPSHVALLILQAFMGISGITSLLLATAVSERHKAQQALEQVHSALEQRMQERGAALAQAHDTFQWIMENVQDYAILILDLQGRVLTWNAGAERITGYGAAEVIGKHFALFYPPDEVECGKPDEILRTAVAEGRWEEEGWRIRKDGGRYWAAVVLTPLWEQPGRLRGFVNVTRDITVRKQMEDKLRYTERLAAIGEMITGLAHESRNALQRAQACLELLQLKAEDRPDLLALTVDIEKALDHLRYLFDEVRGYAAPIRLSLRRADLGKLLREIWQQVDHVGNGRDLRLEEQIPPFNLSCLVDPVALGHVFRNILENSLSMCPDPVIIQVEWAEMMLQGRSAVRVALRDNGPGFTPEARTRLFEPFFTTKTQGTGLGMAIAKRIIATHGGDIAIGANSIPGAEIQVTVLKEGP